MIHKKILSLLVLLMTAASDAWAKEVKVTWSSSDLSSRSSLTTFTLSDVSITCSSREWGFYMGPLTISTTLGNFTKIEITGEGSGAPINGSGFTANSNVSTWTGNTNNLENNSDDITASRQFVFTIDDGTEGPEVTTNAAEGKNDDGSKILSCSPSYIGRVICTDGSIFVSSTEAAAEGKTAVAVIAYVNTVNKTGLALALTNQGQMNWENAKTSCADKNTSTPVTGGTWKLPSQSEWSQMIQGLGGYTAMNNVFASFGGDNLTNNYWSSTPNGNDKAVYYRSSNGGWGATSRTQNAVFVRACLEFNINLFISENNTQATFAMPAYDATVDYELVRDMSVSMTTTVGGVTDNSDYRIRLKKKDSKWELADLTVDQVKALFKVHDAIENKDLAFSGDGAVCAISIYALDAQDKPTGKAVAFADLEPGRYVAIAKAADGTAYDGQTAQSNAIVLFQGYEVTVPAKEFVTYYKEENLKLESETSSDGELYTISTVNDDKAVLSAKRDIVPANVAMLIYNPTDVAKTFLLIPTDETPASFMSYQYFIGTLTASTIAASTSTQNNYAFNGKEFVWVKNAISVGANKAWLAIPTTVPAGTRSISIVFGDGTTGIESIDNGQ